MNRYGLITLMAVFCVLLLAQPPGSAQELRRIHYGTSVSISHLPVWVAKDAGFFAKKGLNVEPVQIGGRAQGQVQRRNPPRIVNPLLLASGSEKCRSGF